MNWHTLTTRPNAEAKAAEDLRGENLWVWFPRTRARISPTQWGERPFYPRYLFTHAPSALLWLAKAHRCQVVTLAKNEYGDRLPAIIPNAVMEVLQAGFDASGLALPKTEFARARFKALQSVRITDGVLKDCLASVINDDGGDKIRVLLNSLGKTTVSREHLVAA